MHVPNADLVVTSVALAIIVTLGLQSTTKRWLAQRLHLLEGDPQPPTGSPLATPAGVTPTPGS
jgi:NhaP-type Na+/H+ or K+/H+ antiporter